MITFSIYCFQWNRALRQLSSSYSKLGLIKHGPLDFLPPEILIVGGRGEASFRWDPVFDVYRFSGHIKWYSPILGESKGVWDITVYINPLT